MSLFSPFFSIVIPTYNRADRLRIALESISSQTFKNFEVLVCDDGSTDNTNEVVKEYGDKFNITYIWEENWWGPARPRNNGIRVAKGEWICFLDSDDSWYPNKIEILYEFITENPLADFVCHQLILNNILTGERRIMPCGSVAANLYRDLIVSGNRFLNSASSIKKSTLTKNKIEISECRNFVSVEDFDLYLQLASCNAVFACINIPLGEYLLETNNISNSQFHLQNLESMLKFHVFEKQTFEPNKKKLWREVLCRLNINKSKLSLIRGNYFRSLLFLIEAITVSPANFSIYIINKFHGAQ